MQRKKRNTSEHKDPRGGPQTERMFYLVILAVSRSPNLTPVSLAAHAVMGISGSVCECLSPGRKEQDLSVDPQSDFFSVARLHQQV